MEGPTTEHFAKAAADRNSSTAAPTQPSVTMPTVPKVTEILVQISRRTRQQNLVPSSSLRLQMAPRQPVELCQPSESLTILPITGANQIVVRVIVPRSSVHQVVKNLRPLVSGFNLSLGLQIILFHAIICYLYVYHFFSFSASSLACNMHPKHHKLLNLFYIILLIVMLM